MLIISITVISLVGCGNGAEKGTKENQVAGIKDSADKGEKKLVTPAINNELDLLYLENWASPGHDQLNQLFQPDPKKIEKLYFQFCYKNSDEISLVVYSAKKNNREFKKNVILTNLKKSGVKLSDYSEVIFGAQETTKKDNSSTLQSFISAINRADSKYLLFTPRVEQASDGLFYIIYTVEGIKSLTEASFSKVTIGEINPSPPKDAF